MHHSDICLCRTGRRPESNLSPISLPVVPTSSGDEEDDTLASLSTALNGRLQQDILAFRSTRQLLTLLEASPNMQQVFQTGMDACDALGIQLVWFFLAMAIFVGPLAMLFSAIQDPTNLISLKRTQAAAFAMTWKSIADPLDKRYAKYKEPFLKPISGVVLDLGSGLGQNLKYLDASKITRLLLIEPNPGMHEGLKRNALAAGFKKDQFQIVPCGAEEKAKVEQLTGLGPESVDSVVSLLALCGIPESRKVIAALYDYLKPGGTFYFFEHVASKHRGPRQIQDRLTPLWKFLFDGCNLNRATNKWILESFEWEETKEMTVDFENQNALDPKSYGWARKPSRQ